VFHTLEPKLKDNARGFLPCSSPTILLLDDYEVLCETIALSAYDDFFVDEWERRRHVSIGGQRGVGSSTPALKVYSSL
jgi:hypothetical protein